MNHQSVELSVWLGMAVLVVVWAGVGVRRARRRLDRSRQDVGAPEGMMAPAAVEGTLGPAPVEDESTSEHAA